MPQAAETIAIDTLAEMLEASASFMPTARGEAISRRWLEPLAGGNFDEFRSMCIMIDSAMLVIELMRYSPSSNGSTAFDRMAKARGRWTPPQAAALAALQASRFGLLRVEADLDDGDIAALDLVSREAMRIPGETLQAGLAGTVLFGRVVMLGGGLCCLAGAITPLDQDALDVANAHPARGARAGAAAARWAEAIYCHVVRHGTVNVPGVNRPADTADEPDEYGFDDEDSVVAMLVREWTDLGGEAPDDELLQRTRGASDLMAVVCTVNLLTVMPVMGLVAMQMATERIALVQMETVVRRERIGSRRLSLDDIARHIEAGIAQRTVNTGADDVFRALRARMTGGESRGAEDAGQARLLQRIRGLRAKTVEQGCTEQEALAAAEKVAELLDRHGLSLGELDFRAQPCDGAAVQTSRQRLTPLDDCVPAIAAFFECRVWAERSKGQSLRYIFFGVQSDVAAAQYLYELVERAFATETDLFRAGALYESMAGERRSATRSFQAGLAAGICRKLKAIRAARNAQRLSGSGRDLVPIKHAMVDEELAKLGLDFRAGSAGSSRGVLKDAFAAGADAAQRFEWAPGIECAA